MINILLVDQRQIFSQSLTVLLNQETDMKVIDMAKDVARIKTVKIKPDVILVNIRNESENIDEITATLIKTFPKSKVIYVLSFVDGKMIIKGIEAGVEGFILDGYEPAYFINAIRDIYHDQYVLSGDIAKVMLDEINVRHRDEKEILQQRLEEKHIKATKRDLDVLYLIFKNKTNKEIAETLQLSEKTIRDYVSMAYRRIGIKNRKKVHQFVTEIMQDS